MGKKERLSELLSGCSESFRNKIFHIENYKIRDDSGEEVHTLPYYLNNGLIMFDEEKKNCRQLIHLMDTNNCIALCNGSTAESMTEHEIFTGNLSGISEVLSNPNKCFLIKGRSYFDLEEHPDLLTIKKSNVNISEVLGINSKPKNSNLNNNSDLTVDKQKAFLKIGELLREYKQNVSVGDVTQGIRLLECLNEILENLMYFPEYINENSIRTIFKEISSLDVDWDKYAKVLDYYNRLDEEINNSRLESGSDNVITKLDRRIERIASDDESDSIINEEEDNVSDKRAGFKIHALGELARLISPLMNDSEINSIISLLSQDFDIDLTNHSLTIDEKDIIREKITKFEGKRKLKNSNGDDLIYIYLDDDDDLINEGRIGKTDYILIRDEYKKSRKTEIHTMDGIYEIDASDRTNVGFRHIFSKDRKKHKLEVYMPIKPSSFEKVSYTKPDDEQEIYMRSGENDYSVHKRRGDYETTFYYKSKADVLNARPSGSEGKRVARPKSILSLFFPNDIFPELDDPTCRAVKHSIKGVIPKEILEIYRTVNPEVAKLIENYGLRVQEESEKKYSISFLNKVPTPVIDKNSNRANIAKKPGKSFLEDHDDPE